MWCLQFIFITRDENRKYFANFILCFMFKTDLKNYITRSLNMRSWYWNLIAKSFLWYTFHLIACNSNFLCLILFSSQSKNIQSRLKMGHLHIMIISGRMLFTGVILLHLTCATLNFNFKVYNESEMTFYERGK